MKLFCTDLDNTLIYSYKHDIGLDKINVEIYEGREVSFMTRKSYELLKAVNEKYQIIPVTTRTIQQYERIDLGLGQIEYALTCNGGILLKNGISDEKWYEESLQIVSESQEQIDMALSLLDTEKQRTFELRYIENLFVYTKCDSPEDVVNRLKSQLDCTRVDVFNNGVKVYVVPKSLNKGSGISRLRKLLNPEYVVAAGDSEFDVSLVSMADMGFVPYGFNQKFGTASDIKETSENVIFSDELLEQLL